VHRALLATGCTLNLFDMTSLLRALAMLVRSPAEQVRMCEGGRAGVL
jgi:hypothetical protein